MKIGEFAKLNDVTLRTLRHYEQMGLLEPAGTDPATGYRYYEEGQSGRLRLIAALKRLGFSLSEIAALINSPPGRTALLETLEIKLTQAAIDLDGARTRLRGLEALIDIVKKQSAGGIVFTEALTMDLNNADGMFGEELFIDLAEKVFARALKDGFDLSAVVVDIDGLGDINTEYGPEAGNGAIDSITGELTRNLPGVASRGKNSWLDRKGGDEYIMLLEDVGIDEAAKLAGELCAKVKSLGFGHLGIKRPVTISAGVACTDMRPGSAKELVAMAEAAMLGVKSGGGDGAQRYPEE